MEGSFGVFCGSELVSGTFGNDVAADEHRRIVADSGEYDAWELVVREVPEDYALLTRCLHGLRQDVEETGDVAT